MLHLRLKALKTKCIKTSSINILKEIGKIDPFEVKTKEFDELLNSKVIEFIPDIVLDKFINIVRSQSVLGKAKVNKDVKIVYSPLNGTGLVPVTRTLKEMGYTNITVVAEQEKPDGNFPTCPYPNPEIKEAMALGMPIVATDCPCGGPRTVMTNEVPDQIQYPLATEKVVQ